MWFHSNLVSCAEFSADGNRVLTASAVEGSRIWNVNTGEPVSPGFAYRTVTKSDTAKAFFSPNEQFIVSSGADNYVERWDLLNNGQRIEVIPTAKLAFSAKFDPSGRLVLITEGNDAIISDGMSGLRLGPKLGKDTSPLMFATRSEERRVGKECRL